MATDALQEAHIAAVANMYDALTTKRPYKEAFLHERAVEIIRESSGTHFDPQVVTAFVALQQSFPNLATPLADEHHVRQAVQPMQELLPVSS